MFFAGTPEDNSGLTEESLRRLNFAVKMYNEKITGNILFSGGFREDLNILNGSEKMAMEALKKGVDRTNIYFENKSYDTITNLKESLQIAYKKNWKNIYITSSLFHLWRTKYLIKDLSSEGYGNLDISFVPYKYTKAEPKIKRKELFIDFHYNLGAFVLKIIMPDSIYKKFVRWLRIGN